VVFSLMLTSGVVKVRSRLRSRFMFGAAEGGGGNNEDRPTLEYVSWRHN
jgi:hypothetical protein